MWGTHWVNIDMMFVPSGHSVLSTVEGITVSLKGCSAARPERASWNAFSTYSSESQSSRTPV